MSNIVPDELFVPSAKALKVVNYQPAAVKTPELVKAEFQKLIQGQAMSSAQLSVLCRIQFLRGQSVEAIAADCQRESKQVERYVVEGMAIMATQEITRTVAAIRNANSAAGYLGAKAVALATDGLADSESKIAALEMAAVSKNVKALFVTNDEKAPSEDLIRTTEELARKAVVDQGQTENVGSINAMIPHLSEKLGLTRKTRDTNKSGSGGAQLLSVHLTNALKDMREMENLGGKYEITPDDLKQLLNLLNFIGMDDLMPLVKDHTSLAKVW